jgi:hypothetical protein
MKALGAGLIGAALLSAATEPAGRILWRYETGG